MTHYSDQSDEFPDQPLTNYESVFRDDALNGKYAFVTGGGSGINFRITESFMRHGCNVAIASRNINRVKTASERLERKYPNVRCLYFRMDVTNENDVVDCVDNILKEYPRIDILINGAAGNFLCKLEKMSFNAFKKVLMIDTFGSFYCLKTVFEKSMKNNKNKSYIINITATLDFKGDLYQGHAGSAKAAINALTRHAAVEWGKYNINVNSLAPGPISGTTGMFKLGGFMINQQNNIDKIMSKGIPLKRFGTKKEMADICTFLCSGFADYIHGHILVADGGAWLTSGIATDNPMMDKMVDSFASKRTKKSSKL